MINFKIVLDLTMERNLDFDQPALDNKCQVSDLKKDELFLTLMLKEVSKFPCLLHYFLSNFFHERKFGVTLLSSQRDFFSSRLNDKTLNYKVFFFGPTSLLAWQNRPSSNGKKYVFENRREECSVNFFFISLRNYF
jgi:hypothetical protein